MNEYARALEGTGHEWPPIADRGNDDDWFEDMGPFDPADLNDRSYPNLGPYPNREVVSVLRKEIKLGRPEQAIYWLSVMLQMGSGSKGHLSYIARQLWIVAAEDLFDQQIVLQAFAVNQMIGLASETDHLYQLVYRMATTPNKLHTTDGGREMDWLWGKAIGEIKRGRWRKMPSYAVDQHTYRGKILIRKDVHVDQRFNGTDFGRQSTQYLWARDGEEMGPRSDWDGGWWQHWKRVKEMFGMGLRYPLRKKGDEPDKHEDRTAQTALVDLETGERLG